MTRRGSTVDIETVVVTLGAVFLGAALSEGRSILDERRLERRQERKEQRESQLERLRQTRKFLDALVQESQANARGDLAAVKKAVSLRESQELGDLYLVGDDEVALAWRDLLVHLSDRLGRGLAVDDIVMSVDTMARVSEALARQEDRARAGKPLEELSAATIEHLRDARALADRMMGFDLPPTPAGRVTRWVVDF